MTIASELRNMARTCSAMGWDSSRLLELADEIEQLADKVDDVRYQEFEGTGGQTLGDGVLLLQVVERLGLPRALPTKAELPKKLLGCPKKGRL